MSTLILVLNLSCGVQEVVKGPRASAAFCAVTAAFVAGLAGTLHMIELGARCVHAGRHYEIAQSPITYLGSMKL